MHVPDTIPIRAVHAVYIMLLYGLTPILRSACSGDVPSPCDRLHVTPQPRAFLTARQSIQLLKETFLLRARELPTGTALQVRFRLDFV